MSRSPSWPGAPGRPGPPSTAIAAPRRTCSSPRSGTCWIRSGGRLAWSGESSYCCENALPSFRCFLKHRGDVLDLCRSGFPSALPEELGRLHESAGGTAPWRRPPSSGIPSNGALLSTGPVWLSKVARTSPEDMARCFWGAVSPCRAGPMAPWRDPPSDQTHARTDHAKKTGGSIPF